MIKRSFIFYWFAKQYRSQKTQIYFHERFDKLSDIIAYNDLPEPKQLQIIQLSPQPRDIIGSSLQVLLALQGPGGCGVVNSVKIWYEACPSMQREDVEFRKTPTRDHNIVVSGTCKQLVGVNVPHNPATMICNNNGTWTNFNNTCPCLKGQERINGVCTGK